MHVAASPPPGRTGGGVLALLARPRGSRRERDAAWRALRRHQRAAAQVPDPIAHADRHLAVVLDRPRERRPPELVRVAAAGGGFRPVVLLDPEDEVDYRAAVGAVAGVVERSLGPWASAERLADHRGVGLLDWRTARRRHLRLLRRLSERPRAAGATADVRDCYGSMGAPVVAEALLRAGAHPAMAHRVAGALDRFAGAGIRGLPVGPEPSAVLASAVLASGDRAVAGEGCVPVRWVDDTTVVGPSAGSVERALQALGEAMALAGLALHPDKTGPLDGALALSAPRPRSGDGPGAVRAGDPWDVVARAASGRPEAGDRLVAALRAVTARPAGRPEAGVLASLAADRRLEGTVRAWAWRAMAPLDPAACREAARAEPDPRVRRGALIAVAAGPDRDGATATRVLRAALGDRAVADTAAWGLARRPRRASPGASGAGRWPL
ncbi:MAG: hypothetical protein HY658_04695 [Actinobacteria bacterium]|nr:hypothetical protein [Actinomycetota bacterium]